MDDVPDHRRRGCGERVPRRARLELVAPARAKGGAGMLCNINTYEINRVFLYKLRVMTTTGNVGIDSIIR